MAFSVSVIIPVYNGERFVEKAIKSVVLLSEVFEVIVINDGSTDRTLLIVEKLQLENSKLKIFHHKNNVNKGRSASRNLGIQNATGNYIAFLDCDDFYLPNRFSNDKQVLSNNKHIDGIYNAIGAHFYRKTNALEKERLKLTTLRKKIESKLLFETLLEGKDGHFSIDGLTVKKNIFETVGYFDETLEVAEDTHMFYKMALKSHLETGVIDMPVAIRGVHEFNVFNKDELYNKNRLKLFETLIFWSSRNKISFKRIDTLLKWLWLIKYKEEKSLFKNIFYWNKLMIKNSKILFSKLSIKYFPLIRLRKKIMPFLFR